MIEIDESEFTEVERDFLKRWAEALDVPLAVLVIRIVSAEVDGDHYVRMRPRD